MDKLLILKWPNERLHLPCEEVTIFDAELQNFGEMLLKTMKVNRGIGLAAPQVNVHKNIIAIWVEEPFPMILVNPKIVELSSELFNFGEGCLSVPGYFEDRDRPKHITLEYQDIYGVHQKATFSDLTAFCIQHEIDHLKGKLFIDNLSMLKKDRIKTKIRKQK